MNSSMLIGIAELRTNIDPKQTLEDRLRATMREASNHWLVIDEQDQFRMAIGAVMVEATEEEQERLNIELKVLKAISTAINGIPVDWSNLVSDSDRDKFIGLSDLWREVKAE